MVLTRTPLRCSLFGGGSDYPEYFLENGGGAVLGMAINKYVYVNLQHMPPGQELTEGVPLRYRIHYSQVDNCNTVDEIQHRAIRRALQYYGVDAPLCFNCWGDMPGRAGLGSSSAFCVGALKALQHHFHLPPTESPFDLASEAISFERHVIPETVGFQDQVFAAVGGLNYIAFNQRGTRVQRLQVPITRQQELERSLVLVYSGEMRDAHAMAQKQVAEIPQKNDALVNLVRLAQHGRDILLDTKQSLQQIGLLLNVAWRSKVRLCPEVTTPAIDALYQRGLGCGAVGGKLLGAGAGGFLLFFVPPERRCHFEKSVGATCISFKIAHGGSRIIPLES